MSQSSITLPALIVLWLRPKLNAVAYWYLSRVESHYLISAEVESNRLTEAQLNVAYYQKQAAIARSNKMKFK